MQVMRCMMQVMRCDVYDAGYEAYHEHLISCLLRVYRLYSISNGCTQERRVALGVESKTMGHMNRTMSRYNGVG